MSAHLMTAIRIGEAARGILNKTKRFPESEDLSIHEHIGVEPMLLALAMELALKAWFVFDYNDAKAPWTHDLIKLFEKLKPESQEKLDLEFKASVAPYHPDWLHIDYSIRDLLHQHKDAFVAWRYLHQRKQSLRFNQGAFEATLEMVLREFEKRYRIVPLAPR